MGAPLVLRAYLGADTPFALQVDLEILEAQTGCPRLGPRCQDEGQQRRLGQYSRGSFRKELTPPLACSPGAGGRVGSLYPYLGDCKARPWAPPRFPPS